MNFSNRTILWAAGGAATVVLLLGLVVWWQCVVWVPPGKFLVLTHRWGKDLPPGDIIAPDESSKGVMLEVLPEGWHFLNPLAWSYEVHEMKTVPPGKCLVLTRRYGKEIPKERLETGDVLAQVGYPVPDNQRGSEDRGILRDVLPPGSYRINPHAYEAQLQDAVEIRTDQVGVRTLKLGKDPHELPPQPGQPRYVVPAGYRGVQEEPVPNGTYYINPYVESITPVDVRSHRVELEDIQFPSRDGFILKPHIQVEYAVLPEHAPRLFMRVADGGKLHQADSTPQQQKENEILQRVILPHMRGYARIEGSNFDARDFINTSGAENPNAVNYREQLQRTLLAKVKPLCEELGIDVRAVTLAAMDPPPELIEQISARDLARVQQEKNKIRLEELKTEQGFKAAEALREQEREKKLAETRLTQAKVNASQRKEVMESQLRTELEAAQLRLDAAREEAKAVLAQGKAEADLINLQNEAEVAGLRTAVRGFSSVSIFAQYQMLSRLGPALSEIFATDDGDFARVLTTYMTPPKPPAPAAAGNGEAPK
jgi:hypothetical protein